MITSRIILLLESLQTIYRFLLGDFFFDGLRPYNQNWLLWVFFFISTFFLMLIMLNLIIAIMGDTYNRVQLNAASATYRELADLIFESDLYMWRRRRIPKYYPDYILVSTSENLELGEDEWERYLESNITAVH